MSRRCYLSAPVDVDVEPLVRGLAEHGWEAYVLSDVAKLGLPLRDSVQDAIRGANVVIAVFGNGGPSTNTAYEAGLAVGLGKPVVSVVGSRGSVPTDLLSSLHVRADLDNVEAITLALDNLDRLLTERTTDRSPDFATKGHPLGSYADELLAELEGLRDTSHQAKVGQALERIIVRALEGSGALAVAATRPEEGFDVGVWSDDLDAIAANPVLIEIKTRIDQGAIAQCLMALERVPVAKAALIVSLEDATQSASVVPRWPVLWISIEDLLRQLRTRSFAEVFRALRNRSVHGEVR